MLGWSTLLENLYNKLNGNYFFFNLICLGIVDEALPPVPKSTPIKDDDKSKKDDTEKKKKADMKKVANE